VVKGVKAVVTQAAASLPEGAVKEAAASVLEAVKEASSSSLEAVTQPAAGMVREKQVAGVVQEKWAPPTATGEATAAPAAGAP
jgi:hypothetical protein